MYGNSTSRRTASPCHGLRCFGRKALESESITAVKRKYKYAASVFATLTFLASGAGCGDGDSDEAPDQDQKEIETPEVPAEADFEQAGAERLKVSVDHLSAGGGAVWGNWEAAMIRIDPDTGEQTDEICIPEAPCGGSEFGDGAVWTQTCTEDGLARVDSETLEVTHVPLDSSSLHHGNSTIGFGEGTAWVIADGKGCEACVLIGVDADSLAVSHEIEVEPGASSVVVGLGSVWVANPKSATISMVDVATDEISAEIPVEGAPQYLAAGEGGIWAFDQLGGNVVELGPDGEEVRTIEADMAGAGGSISTGEGSVWVSGPLALLEEIDPETGEILARYGPRSSGGDVLVAYGWVWASRYQEEFEDLLRLELGT